MQPAFDGLYEPTVYRGISLGLSQLCWQEELCLGPLLSTLS